MNLSDQHLFISEAARAIQLEASPLADRIRSGADTAGASEEQLVMACDSLLADFARRLGLKWEPRGERSVAWLEEGKKRRGSIDRLFDRVVVEYERPGSLQPTNNAPANQHAIRQVRNYMDGLIAGEGWQEKSVAGVVLDGYRIIYCRYGQGTWIQEAPLDVNAGSVGRLLRLLLTFQRPPLLPDLLLSRFGAESEITTGAVTALYETLVAKPLPLTQALFRQWQDFFADIAGLSPETLAQKKELIRFAARIVGREEPDPACLLFSLYTYSALLTKLLAVLAVTPFFLTDDSDRLATWAAGESDDRRERLRDVESGEFFRRLGITNFTEGDFFGWYCGEWTPKIADSVRAILQALSEYDPDTVEQAPEQVRDLLKRLYHGLFPRAVRHDLGEYYTPDWLAERLLSQLDPDLFGEVPTDENARQEKAARVKDRLASTRFIDPACGSGTFLVLILRRLRQWARECGVSERDILLPAVTEAQNVMGFDLNPLAVISARANYLLAIGDLLHPGDDLIEIPIYLADSIVLPAKGNGEGLFDTEANNYRLPLRGVGEVFTVPEQIADSTRMRTLATLLRVDIEREVGRGAFVQVAERLLGVTGRQYYRIKETLGDLYDTLFRLHKEGKNGLWADIAKNMFMPLFVKKADFVVGNPPWVNWESLPQEYRDRSREIWVKYGLFGHKGFETILGKGKKDVSTLLAYVAADLYLRDGGRLGFVITQSVFKTAAGQGFRRFKLGNGEPLKVISADDFSAIQPFEGATNRTATVILQKSRPNVYPVPYNIWRKRPGPRIPFSARIEDLPAYLVNQAAFAEPVVASDPGSSWLTGSKMANRAIRKVLGRSAYTAHAGAYSGGANGVYWLQRIGTNVDGTVRVRNMTEGTKREVREGLHNLEADMLFPLLRERQVTKWRTAPEPDIFFLMVQDTKTRRGIEVNTLSNQLPRTFAYLRSFEPILRERPAYKRYFRPSDAFYSMFNTAEYTFSPIKVVWGNIASRIEAAVIHSPAERPLIPQHTVTMVALDDIDEAHYLCALINSTPFDLAVRSYSEEGGKSFGTPHVLENIAIPRFVPENAAHLRLAELSRMAHDMTKKAEPAAGLADVETEVDECAASVWGLTAEELATITRASEG